MKDNATLTGIVAAIGISMTAAVALPLVNVFKTLTPGELMVMRGGVSASLFALLFSGHISIPTKNVLMFSTLFGLANFSLYQAIRVWGANPTIVILTMTPVVNIVAKWWRAQQVDLRVTGSLGLLLVGVFIALNPWQTDFVLAGFLLSVTATILIGIGFEILGVTKNLDPYAKSFWIAVLMIVIGAATTLGLEERIPFSMEAWDAQHLAALLGYGVVGGFLYILANVIAFEKLKTEVASTLAMGETPAVIIGVWITLGEALTIVQWCGVLLAVAAAIALAILEAKASAATKESEEVT